MYFMKKLYLILFVAFLAIGATAQPLPPHRPMGEPKQGFRQGGGPGPEGREGKKERIEMFKIQFITEKLSLTTAEAQLFWPVYESHKKAVQEIIANKSTDEILLQEAMLNARKKYKADLKPVLKTDERVNEALKADREFLHKVRFEMMRRKGFQS
jgi:hypothetical protein